MIGLLAQPWSVIPSVVSGAWVFRGTRVPVTALFQNLEDGAHTSQTLLTGFLA